MPDSDELSRRFKTLEKPERKQLVSLQKRLERMKVTPETVGEVLPEAVLLGEAKSGNLSRSMVEVLEKALAFSIKKNPLQLSAILFPIIGPAIRQAVRKVMADMMENMNSTLGKAFSLRRLKWRLEAWKTGVPFAEIMFREMYRYRVEHVFLIYRESAVLLASVSREKSATADNDMVTSMLFAVQSYIKDSLNLDQEEPVRRITVGDYTVLVEEGPKAVLALVLNGVPDTEVSDLMDETLGNVHLVLGPHLRDFHGDVSIFEKNAELLRPCLLSREQTGGRNSKIPVIIFFLLVLGALGWGIYSYAHVVSNQNAYIRELDDTEGLVLVDKKRVFRHLRLKVLRDSRAPLPEELALESSVNMKLIDFKTIPYISPELEDAFFDARVKVERAFDELRDTILFFEQDSEVLRDSQEATIRRAGTLIREILEFSARYKVPVNVEIVGHANGQVQNEATLAISAERAATAMELFTEYYPDLARYVRPVGVGTASPLIANPVTDEEKEKNRSVTFQGEFQ